MSEEAKIVICFISAIVGVLFGAITSIKHIEKMALKEIDDIHKRTIDASKSAIKEISEQKQ